jgi:hypothetical protein
LILAPAKQQQESYGRFQIALETSQSLQLHHALEPGALLKCAADQRLVSTDQLVKDRECLATTGGVDRSCRYPERIAGVVYLDAGHSWNEDDEAQGFYKIVEWKNRLNDFDKKFHELLGEPFDSRPLARQTLRKNL